MVYIYCHELNLLGSTKGMSARVLFMVLKQCDNFYKLLVPIETIVAELNILDGVTSSTSGTNILDGVTSTAAELNIFDGVTATATEL